MTTDLNAQSVGNYSTVQQRRHEDGAMSGGWWTRPGGGQRTVCQLCPRECNLKPGDRGFCFVRENRDGQIVLSTYGKSTGFCIDPIEKKPLNHFYPGTAVLSFGTAGCNLGCKFCQNWDISKSREVERLSEHAEPETIARAAQQLGCHSVAFTYNDPIVWAEYAIDTARACRQVGIKTVAVTAGYISAEARSEFFGVMDAANVDLKAFTEEFYQKITYSHLQPVLDTLVYLKHETDVWFEITNLVIPGANDSRDELQRMCDYLLQHLGDDTPIHFSAFHPDFRMRETPHTPPEKLAEAYDIARRQGLKYVYVGNVHDLGRQSTYCPNCGQLLIERDWYQLGKYALEGNRCRACDTQIPGRFSTGPGSWGPKRQPVRIAQFAHVEPSSKSVEHRAPAKKEVAMNSSQPSVAGTRSGTARSQVMAKLTAQQRDTLHKAACHWVTQTVLRQPRSAPEQVLDKLAEFTVHGIFVTLKRQDYLRGCCGVLGKPMLLGAATDQAAARTALEDQRMASISPSELPFLHCDVTVLGPLEPIQASAHARAEAVEIGKHGVVIHLGQSSGLLLPSVATERGWNAEQFLEAVCQKASLPPQAWTNPSATVFTFEGQSVSGPFHVDAAHSSALQVPPALTAEQLASYVALAGNNVAALVQGATPSYYAPELPDLNVNALVLSVQWGEPGQTKQGNAMHVSIRPGVPLQSTLFQMCQTVSQLLIRQRYNGAFQVGLSIGIDPAFHGSGEEVFIEGVDTQSRGFVINGPGHCVVGFDPQKPFDQLLESLRSHLPVGGRHGMVHSLEFLSSMRDVIAITSPVAVRASGSREPAVAGKFYPAEDAARREQVAGFFKGPNPKKTKALAIMVPHAGLRYSGQVAADVWRSVELPRSLIIISPKHTPAGINWAVCPFDRWRLSGSVSFSGDPGLAQQIVSQVPGMLFDAAAHEKEHGIEVQLPILEQVAPAAQIVGIAMAGGTWPEIDAAAEGLAAVVRASDQPPLLVISSDMNHYASDAENRRLDRLALDALATGDPQLLLATCRQHQISMCGVIPAALVMATLHKLGQPFKIKEIAYATSGDSSGEKSRVVGYAGTVFLPE